MWLDHWIEWFDILGYLNGLSDVILGFPELFGVPTADLEWLAWIDSIDGRD